MNGHPDAFSSSNLLGIHLSYDRAIAGYTGRGLRSAAIAVFCLNHWLAPVLLAAPKGETVVHGTAQFERSGDLTQITAGQNTIINYQSFDIHRHETVQFIQPNEHARVLNRITGGDPSRIAGTLTANGHVYIANPSGIYFTQGSLVDVGKLFAAAGQITDTQFLNNFNHFTDLTGSVINEGAIRADAIGLIGRHVVNRGSIVASDGFVAMVAGEDVLLGERGGQILVKIERVGDATAGADQPGVENSGTINAHDGVAQMSAGDIYALPIYHTGYTRGKEVRLDGGDHGVVDVSGTLDASDHSPDATGGAVVVSGASVALRKAHVDVSGDSGGGLVSIGRDDQDRGATRESEQTYIGPDTVIVADAAKTGKGGRVILWGSHTAQMYGSVSARGGPLGGDGGFVDISTHGWLDLRSVPDVTAPMGTAGTWLIDPYNVSIESVPPTAGLDATPEIFIDPDGEDSILSAALILSALADGTNVIVRTNNTSGQQAGNIAVNAPISTDATPADRSTLTLRAANDIDVNEAITGSFDLELIANDPGQFDQDLDVNAGDVNINAPITVNHFSAEGIQVRVAPGRITARGDVRIEAIDSVFGRTEAPSSIFAFDIEAGGDVHIAAADLDASDRPLTIGARSGGFDRRLELVADVGNINVDLVSVTENGTPAGGFGDIDVTLNNAGDFTAIDVNQRNIGLGGDDVPVQTRSDLIEVVPTDSPLASLMVFVNAADQNRNVAIRTRGSDLEVLPGAVDVGSGRLTVTTDHSIRFGSDSINESISALTVTAGSEIHTQGISSSGSQRFHVRETGAIVVAGDHQTRGGEIQFNGRVNARSGLLIDTTTDGASGANIVFVRGIIDDSGQSLSDGIDVDVRAGSGDVRFRGDVLIGGGLTVSGTNVAIRSVSTSRDQTYTGNVTTADGATLSGDSVTFNGGLSPNGSSTGKLTVYGHLTLSPETQMNVTLNGGTDHDQVVVNGGDILLDGASLTGTSETVFNNATMVVIASRQLEHPVSVTGRFSGGNSTTIGGQEFGIDYTAGEGKDIALVRGRSGTQEPEGTISGQILTSQFDPDPQLDVERSVIKTETRANFAETSLTVAQRDALRRLGVYARDMRFQEQVETVLSGRRLIDDTAAPGAGPDQHEVAVDRMNNRLVVDALDAAQQLFWEQAIDEQTGQFKVDAETGQPVLRDQRGQIRRTLQQAVRLYRTEVGKTIEPDALSQFLVTDSRVADAHAYVMQLRTLIAHLDNFGLTSQELWIATVISLQPILPKGMTTQQLEQTIRGALAQSPVSDEIEQAPTPSAGLETHARAKG